MVRELPTGRVTFLFTDVEGSTRLLNELGAERYEDALAEHRRSLREAFGRHGGVEVDTQGDSFFFAFADADRALTAAEDAQAALAGGPIRVRIGVHTGEALVGREGYVGFEVHKGARVAAAGHGGQVVASEATRVASGRKLRPLGTHRLKDLAAPEPLWQLGDGEFPPLASLNQTNLPVQPTPLIGRERELREAGELLRESRLLTLAGPGGSGKTRLALQLAADAVEDFPHGVWWVPLQALRDPALVLPTIASTLGAQGDLAEHLTGRRLLLVLDNMEQLVDAAGELAALLTASGELKLLVTSREPLRVVAEVAYAVEPLAEDDAVALFRERAAAGEPLDAVRHICRALDCLPLAIELAAARTTLLSPRELLARLERRLPLLSAGKRDAPDRHRTLRATIEWSYELLCNSEQRLFARLAVFAGSFDVTAAEQVCDADVETMQTLVEKSLLRRWASGRFGFLETIHEYASERLSGLREASEIEQRHSCYYVELAVSAAPMEEGNYIVSSEAARRLIADRDNVRQAVDGAAKRGDISMVVRALGAIWSVWLSIGGAQEAIAWARIVLDHRNRLSERELVTVLVGASELMRFTGDLDSAEQLKLELLELGNRNDDALRKRWVSPILADLAEIALERGDSAAARTYAEESVAKGGGPRSASSLGEVVLREGDVERAAQLFEESAAGYRGVHDLNYAYTFEARGEAARRLGDYARARACFVEGVRRWNELEDEAAAAECLDGLAALALELGDRERAGVMAGAAARFRANRSARPWRPDRRLTDLPETALTRGRAMTLDEAVAYATESAAEDPTCAGRRLSSSP